MRIYVYRQYILVMSISRSGMCACGNVDLMLLFVCAFTVQTNKHAFDYDAIHSFFYTPVELNLQQLRVIQCILKDVHLYIVLFAGYIQLLRQNMLFIVYIQRKTHLQRSYLVRRRICYASLHIILYLMHALCTYTIYLFLI